MKQKLDKTPLESSLNETQIILSSTFKEKTKWWQDRKGFSLVEATVAAIIFAIASVGIFTLISVIRPSGLESEERIGAAYYAQQILADLRVKIDQGTWDTGELSPGVHTATPSGIYSANYLVEEDPETGARKVTVTVNWGD